MFYARFDTTMAIYNYVYSGMAERYQNITVVAAHGGGAAPNLSFTAHASALLVPDGVKNAPQGLESYMKRMYYDTGICASPHALACLDAFVGPSRLVYASDWPFAPEFFIQQGIENTDAYEGFDAREQRRINRDNSLEFLPRLSRLLG
jgi:predicted TIM-barrel fold metal-dependent hydrolase